MRLGRAMTPKRKLELGLSQIFHDLLERTIEKIRQRKKDFSLTYRVIGTEITEITLIYSQKVRLRTQLQKNKREGNKSNLFSLMKRCCSERIELEKAEVGG